MPVASSNPSHASTVPARHERMGSWVLHSTTAVNVALHRWAGGAHSDMVVTPVARPNQRRRRKPKPGQAFESPAGGAGTPQSSRREIVVWTLLFAGAVAALLWKHATVFFYSWTDEQIHMYVARRMTEGAVLYRDIESARPPLVLFPLAWLMRLGLGPLLAGRFLVVAFQLATAGLLLWGGRRLASWRAGALAALLFLTSPEVFARVHYTGIQLAALTASACVLFSLQGRPFRAGLLLGLTLAADQHGLVLGGIVALLTVARRPRDALPFALGALGVCAIVFGGVWAMGGRHLWGSLVAIHLFHFRVGQGVASQFWDDFTPWIYEHVYLFVGAGLAAVLLARGRKQTASQGPSRPASRDVRVLLLVVAAHIAVVLAMSGSVFLYVVVIAPMLALLAGMGFDAALVRCLPEGGWSEAARMARSPRLVFTGLVVIVALTAGGWAAARSHREHLDERQYSFWPHVLHGQVARAQELDPARWAGGDSVLPKQGTIFGDPTIASFLALESGLRVSGELADLNPSWVEGGTVKSEDIVSRIEHDGVAAVITPPFGLIQDPYFKSYLKTCYDQPRPVFPPESGPGQGLPFILAFTHTQGTTVCQVRLP